MNSKPRTAAFAYLERVEVIDEAILANHPTLKSAFVTGFSETDDGEIAAYSIASADDPGLMVAGDQMKSLDSFASEDEFMTDTHIRVSRDGSTLGG